MGNNRAGHDTIGHIYFIQNTVTGNVKIGRAKDVNKRFSALQVSTDCPLRILFVLDVYKMVSDELELHDRFKDYRINGEWFRYEGELFSYINDLILKRINTARDWKAEQIILKNELRCKSKTIPTKSKTTMAEKFIRNNNKRIARKLRQKERRKKGDKLLYKLPYR